MTKQSVGCEQLGAAEQDECAKIRLRIHYSYSDVQRYEALQDEWRIQIDREVAEYTEIQSCLDSLSDPFVFFSNLSAKAGIALHPDEEEDLKD